ncbi:hypothetical protein HanIR_Chr01g0020281 [Helianthus annuus]|nr:hypothetical protein HanIR_Chr01g0020281 [Helianthus annuus]
MNSHYRESGFSSILICSTTRFSPKYNQQRYGYMIPRPYHIYCRYGLEFVTPYLPMKPLLLPCSVQLSKRDNLLLAVPKNSTKKNHHHYKLTLLVLFPCECFSLRSLCPPRHYPIPTCHPCPKASFYAVSPSNSRPPAIRFQYAAPYSNPISTSIGYP